MSHADREFMNLIWAAKLNGRRANPRNGERLRLFVPPAVRFDTTPLVSLRKTAWKNALREMEWFLSGSNEVHALHPAVRKWWEPWQDEHGMVRFNYGEQLRHQSAVDGSGWQRAFDQVAAFVAGIRSHPHSARHVISTWYSPEMYSPECPITNCHGTVIQAQVSGGTLDLFMYQRSADLILGVPHNWVQYWAFLLWVAHRTGYTAGEFVWQGGDVHLYAKHLEMADRIVTAAGSQRRPVPELLYRPRGESAEFLADDFALDGPYEPVITDAVEMVV